MGAPKGHAPYAGCETGGRPPKYDADKEADDLLEWSENPDSYNLMGFLFHKPYTYDQMYLFQDRSEKFLLAYKKALERCAYNRECKLHNKTLNYGVWEKYTEVYDPMLRNYERAKLQFASELKRAEIASYEQADLDKLNAHSALITKAQEALKMAESNSNTEIKS